MVAGINKTRSQQVAAKHEHVAYKSETTGFEVKKFILTLNTNAHICYNLDAIPTSNLTTGFTSVFNLLPVF